ncbi:protein ARV 2-like isoform X3 [Typha latifolia]|uniref:protein ARV 2-like isoform X3 n=1 Tax=Typha latifolia TaxID=4733 RepID=UPI003C2F522D
MATSTNPEAAEKAAEKKLRCVNCGWRVKTLFVQYSPGNIRLMKCDNCKAVADSYVECEFMIILIDLILHKTKAYRHLLFNMLNVDASDNKVQTTAVLRMVSFLKSSRDDGDSSRSPFSSIWTCLKVLLDVLLGNLMFVVVVILGSKFLLSLSFDITRYKEVFLAILISSYFKLFLISMMVWEFPLSVIFIIDIFVFSSNVVALRVITQLSVSRCIAVCFMAHTTKFLADHCVLPRLFGSYQRWSER